MLILTQYIPTVLVPTGPLSTVWTHKCLKRLETETPRYKASKSEKTLRPFAFSNRVLWACYRGGGTFFTILEMEHYLRHRVEEPTSHYAAHIATAIFTPSKFPLLKLVRSFHDNWLRWTKVLWSHKCKKTDPTHIPQDPHASMSVRILRTLRHKGRRRCGR